MNEMQEMNDLLNDAHISHACCFQNLLPAYSVTNTSRRLTKLRRTSAPRKFSTGTERMNHSKGRERKVKDKDGTQRIENERKEKHNVRN